LKQALTPGLGAKLAGEISTEFINVRQDCATQTLGRAAPGKFVETFVQCLQHLDTGSYDEKPNVDKYLNTQVENVANLPDGLRVCGGRIARAMYALRSKRSIAHKGAVDPNTADLALLHQGAAWIVAELLRGATGITMEEAGALIEKVQTPVGSLVEEIEGTRLVHADLSVHDEVLVLLHSVYPNYLPMSDILASLKARAESSVKNRLGELRKDKLIFGDKEKGYRLTLAGFDAAVLIRRGLVD
jgi:hypothetical protein